MYHIQTHKWFEIIPINARAWVQVVMETTKDGTDEHDRLTLLPSANNTIRLPSGQMIWSTYIEMNKFAKLN